MLDVSNRLTVLTTRGVKAVKTFRKTKSGSIEVEGYGRAKTFTAEEIEIDDRGQWLEKLRPKSESFVVLGAPKDWKKGEKKRRLSSARDGADATLVDVPRLWMPIDVDQIDFEPLASIDDGETFALELLDRLSLRGVRCVWHLTNSHGFFGKYRARLWVELERPATCADMKEYAKAKWGDDKVEVDGKIKHIVDFAVYRPAQPIYTGDPILEGVDDPVEKRVGWIDGDALKVKVSSRTKKKTGEEDENIAKLRDAGLYIGRLRPGQHMIRCPWEENHTGEERDDDTFYFEPNYNGHAEPRFKCHHASCEDKWWDHVLEFMGEGGGDEDDEETSPNWVFVRRLDQFWDARDGTLVDTKVYDSTHGGRGKKGTPTEIFLKKKTTRKADIAEFLPGRDRFVRRGKLVVLNTYIDMRIEPDPNIDVSMWEDHLNWLIPDPVERDYIADWLAWVYQRPGEKITWAPILYSSSHGVGKTTVFNCLAHCIGLSHVSEPTQAELEDKFNDWCYGKLLVKIEELMSGDKYHVAEKLKPVVANPTVSVRRMHQTGFVIPNFANVCASTNHMQALPIEKGDRRYMLVQCVEAPEEIRRPRMRAFHKWLEEVGYGGIAHWLNERDVSGFVPTMEAPNTKLKELIVEASKTDFEHAVDLCDVFDNQDIISSAMVAEYLLQNNCKISDKRIGLIAARRGWTSLPGAEGRTRIGNRRITFWTRPGGTMRLRAFLAKKPGERERIHQNLMAKLSFGDDRAAESDDVL